MGSASPTIGGDCASKAPEHTAVEAAAILNTNTLRLERSMAHLVKVCAR